MLKQFCFISFILLLGVVFLMLSAQPTAAATGILKQMNFQGKVVNKTAGTNITDGSYTFVFSLYSASSGGVAIWTESKSVTVTNGIFQTLLGDTTPLPGSVDFNTDNLYLGVNFNADGEMSPRVRMAAVPYAFNALKVAGLTVTDTTGTLTIPNTKTISFADAFTTSGANALTLTTTAATNVTLPATGTLSTLAGVESLTNKTIGSTGLVFSGASTDVTTVSNEALTFAADGTGDFVFTTDADTTFAISNLSTAGGIIYSTSAGGVLGVSAAGTGGDCLKSGGSGAPTWGSCSSGSFVNFIAGSTQTTTSTNSLIDLTSTATGATAPLISVNENGSGTPNLMELKLAGTTVMRVNNDGGVVAPGFAMSGTSPVMFLFDSTGGDQDFSFGADASVFSISNSDTGQNGFTFASYAITVGDNTDSKTMNIGGVSNSAADTINIATNGTAADVITIGNSNAATTLALVGGDDWSISTAGVLTGAALSLNSGSGRVGIATGDFLSTSVAGVSGAAAGDFWYDSTAQKFKINENGTTKTLCNLTDTGCGAGGSGSLDDAYNSGATITVDAADVLFDLNDGTNDYGVVIDNNTASAIATGLEFTNAGGGSFTNEIVFQNGESLSNATNGVIALTTDDLQINSLTPRLIFNETDQVPWQYIVGGDQFIVQRNGTDRFVMNSGGDILIKGDYYNNEDATFNFGAGVGGSTLNLIAGGSTQLALAGSGAMTSARSISGTTSLDVLTLTLTNSSSSGTQRGVIIDNAASTGTTDAMLVIDNSDTDTAVTAGIQFVNAGGGFTSGIDMANLIISNVGNAGTDFLSNGGLTLANTLTVTTGGLTLSAGDLAVNSDNITSDGTLTLDANGAVVLGGSGNTFTFNETTGPAYLGSARPTRQVTLSPEYPGASLTGDGSSNTGTMTSDFCENGASADIPNTNTGVCNTSTDIHTYYSWTTSQGTAQDYDIWIRWRVPDNFSAWAASNPIRVYAKRTDATNNAVTVFVYDTAGTLENAAGTQVAGTTWTNTSVEASFAGTYTAGSYMTIRIQMTADTGGDSVQVGEINLDYLGKN